MSVTAPELTLNPRVEAMRPSETLAMTARAKELRREGRPVVSLSAGEPDFRTPEPIMEAAIQAIHEGFTHYTENAGMLELRQEISAKLKRDNGLDYPAAQILCSNGAKQSVALAVEVLCRPGDEVLIPAPYWVSYPEMVRLAGANPVIVPTSVDNDYRLDAATLESVITDKTRMIIHCSPSNPTGTVYTRRELEDMADVLRRHEQVFILSDEIYEYILFDAEHISFASLPGMKERTITVNGFSKGYAMTGWRLGYLAAEPEIVKAAGKVQSQFTSAPSSITQKAGIAALKMSLEPVEEMVASFRQRRDFVLGKLNDIEGVRCPKPEGAFYLFPDLSAYMGKASPSGRKINNADDLAYYLLDEFNIALVSGAAFGSPEGIRISYAASMTDLETAMERFAAGLRSLQ